MAVTPIQLRPTFPLDERRIQRMKRELIAQSPRLVWGQFVAYVAGKLRSAGFGSERGLIQNWLDWWANEEQELTARVVGRLVTQSNIDQDEAIHGMIRRLQNNGHVPYAISLGRILLLKQHIERGLHRNGVLSERKEQIEVLVDSICQEVCNELYLISDADEELAVVLTSRDPKRLEAANEELRDRQSRIMHSYATLHDTASHLAVEAEPVTSEITRIENSVLDRLIENLREENEIAKTIDDRIRTELPKLDHE